MRSASTTVDSRWAITSVVRPRIRVCKAPCTLRSDSVSRDDVASSSSRIGALRSMARAIRSEEHTSELQSRHISYAVFCLKKKIGTPDAEQSHAETVVRGEDDLGVVLVVCAG